MDRLIGSCAFGFTQDGGEVATMLLAFLLSVSLVDPLLNHEVDGSVSCGLGLGDSGGLGFGGSGGLGSFLHGDSDSITSSFRGARSQLLAEDWG